MQLCKTPKRKLRLYIDNVFFNLYTCSLRKTLTRKKFIERDLKLITHKYSSTSDILMIKVSRVHIRVIPTSPFDPVAFIVARQKAGEKVILKKATKRVCSGKPRRILFTEQCVRSEDTQLELSSLRIHFHCANSQRVEGEKEYPEVLS